jgi:hypothetical protein
MKKLLLSTFTVLCVIVLNFNTYAQVETKLYEKELIELSEIKVKESVSSIPKCFCCNPKIFSLPNVPPINGLDSICKGVTNVFKTINCPGATFNWTLSPAAVTFTGNGTNQITINPSSIPLGTTVVTIYIEIRCGNTAVKNVIKVKVCKQPIVIKEGFDAMLHGLSGLQANNYGTSPVNPVSSWTFNGTPGTIYSVIQFSIPTTLVASDITNATLSLKEFINSSNGNHTTQYGGATKPTKFVIQRVTASWTESGTSFANLATSSTTTNQVYVPNYTGGSAADDININVTQLVKDMITNGNYGFMLRWEDNSQNTYYRSRWFGSFNCTDVTKKPVLTIN